MKTTHDRIAPDAEPSDGHHRYAKRARRCLALAATVLGASTIALATSSAASAAGWVTYNLRGDGCADAATIDANGNRLVDEAWFDLDNDCRWDTHLWNSAGGENLLDSLTFDMDENGRPESYLWESNQVAGFDYVYYDQNADGYYEAVLPFRPTPVQSLFEQINANNGYYHDDLSRVFGSCLTMTCW